MPPASEIGPGHLPGSLVKTWPDYNDAGGCPTREAGANVDLAKLEICNGPCFLDSQLDSTEGAGDFVCGVGTRVIDNGQRDLCGKRLRAL